MKKGLNKWIRVDDKLPRNGQRIICKYQGVYSDRIVTFWRDGANDHFGLHNELDGEGSQPATHWRKL